MLQNQKIQSSNQKHKTQILTFACLEQPQTIDYLNYLQLSYKQSQYPGKAVLNFNSESDENNKSSKKNKEFAFNGLHTRNQKIKHQFSKLIKDVVLNTLKGQNQTFFIYGTQQKSKDKILFGQSQNPGLLLCVLSQLFDTCHEKAIEDDVTIKLSCSLFKKARFYDIFGGNGTNQIEFCKDQIQGGVLHSIPQIIIRNAKTGLKLFNIILKQITDHRQQDLTQNLYLSLKIQMDCQKTEDETSVYCLSKINFVKFANPSVNSSLKGVNKNNIWFINLLNYIQAPSISSGNADVEQVNTSHLTDANDEFTSFLIQTCFVSSHKIFGFISITNKMTSNQCLTALLFAHHLKNCKTQGSKYIINIPQLQKQIKKFHNSINSDIKSSGALKKLFAHHQDLLYSYMSQLNYLQFQYSLVIGQACQKLNKYIFTQQLQDFFYAKKIDIDESEDLLQAYTNVSELRNNIKLSKKTTLQALDNKQTKKWYQKYLDLYFSMAHHFLISGKRQKQNESSQVESQKTGEYIKENEKQHQQIHLMRSSQNSFYKINQSQSKKQHNKTSALDQQCQRQNERNENIGKRNQMSKQSKMLMNVTCSGSFGSGVKKNNQIDNLQSMFTNKNVGVNSKKNKFIL